MKSKKIAKAEGGPKEKEEPEEEAEANSWEEDVEQLAAKLQFSLPSRAEEVDEEVLAKAKREAPEMLALLKQLQTRVGGLQESVKGLSERFVVADDAKWGANSDEGPAAYVEVKVQMLLSYIIGLVYYLILKSQGIPVRDHPVALRLLWIRTVLEKLRPVDQRLQYQITKLLQWAESRKSGGAGKVDEENPMKPGALAAGVEDEDEDEDEDTRKVYNDGLYKPPKVAQVEYTGTHESMREKAERDLERKKTRLEKSEFIRNLREEFTDAPTEIHGIAKSSRGERAERKMAEQQAEEEDWMRRERISRKKMKGERQLRNEMRTLGSGAVSLDDAVVDFDNLGSLGGKRDQVMPGRGAKRQKGAGGLLEEFNSASKRARMSRNIMDSVEGGDLGDFAPVSRGRGRGRGRGAKRRNM